MNIQTSSANPVILIAEDEPKIASLLAEYLERDGFETDWAQTGSQAQEKLRANTYDLVLLDLMLPEVDGLQICREIRAESDLPVIMVTARVEEVDRLLGLELGADDYICKPFSPREVVARVRTVLRRAVGGGETTSADAGALVVNAERRQISIDNERLTLTQSEFELFSTLAARPGVVFSRAKLLDAMGEEFRDVSDRAVDSHIKNLRKKIAAIRPGQTMIQSVYGVGYKFELSDDTTA